MGFFAGFILCSTINMSCQTYVDPHEYSNFHECRAKGNILYNQLIQTASSDDVVLGDCSEVPDGIDPKDFFTRLLKPRISTGAN